MEHQSGRQPLLTVDPHPAEPGVWVLSGDLDLAAVEYLKSATAECTGVVVMDMQHLTFVDSSGLHALMGLASRLAADGGSLLARNPSHTFERLTAITGTAELFGV
jgi:anti-anti-sigma factor